MTLYSGVRIAHCSGTISNETLHWWEFFTVLLCVCVCVWRNISLYCPYCTHCCKIFNYVSTMHTSTTLSHSSLCQSWHQCSTAVENVSYGSGVAVVL